MTFTTNSLVANYENEEDKYKLGRHNLELRNCAQHNVKVKVHTTIPPNQEINSDWVVQLRGLLAIADTLMENKTKMMQFIAKMQTNIMLNVCYKM